LGTSKSFEVLEKSIFRVYQLLSQEGYVLLSEVVCIEERHYLRKTSKNSVFALKKPLH
jgi:hypothetical protein